MFSLFAVAGIGLAVAACGGSSSAGSGDSSQPVKVGLIVSLTGNYAPLGSEDKKSVELAVQQINDKGGLLGRKIELTVKDDKSQPDQSVLAFNELKSAGVAAVIGSPFSNSALATIPQVDRDKIPYVSLTPADEQVKPIHPYVFVVPATSGTYAERILQYYQAQRYTQGRRRVRHQEFLRPGRLRRHAGEGRVSSVSRSWPASSSRPPPPNSARCSTTSSPPVLRR